MKPSKPVAGEAPDNPPPAGGRESKERTVQVSLRLPASWIGLLRQRALAAAAVEEKMVTPQEIVRRMIDEALRNETEV